MALVCAFVSDLPAGSLGPKTDVKLLSETNALLAACVPLNPTKCGEK